MSCSTAKQHCLQNSIGQIALSGILALSLGAGLASPPINAVAAPVVYEQGTFTVKSQSNSDAAYDVYPVFYADMDERGGEQDTFDTTEYPVVEWPGIATQISWNDNAKASVLAFLESNGYGNWIKATFNCSDPSEKYTFEYGLPQNAAEFIAQQIGASAIDADAATVPPSKAQKTFALNLARAIAAAGVTPGTTTLDDDGNATFTGTEGYYLFVTKDSSVDADEAGTSPIWVPLGGTTKEITEKTAIPTLDKKVKEDATGEYGYIADSNAFQDLDYKLTATMPQNIQSFNNYWMGFADTLPEGMHLANDDVSSVKVMLTYKFNGNEYSSEITNNSFVQVKYDTDENMLKVNLIDLKKIYPDIDKDAIVEVFYKAHLTSQAFIGAAGNKNNAKLTYTANPITYYDPYDPANPKATRRTAYSTTTDPESPDFDPALVLSGIGATLDDAHRTTTCTWKVNLQKVDKQTHEGLAGAKFSFRVAETENSSDTTSTDKYVQEDGSLGETEFSFTTDENGKLTVPRIDSGSYIIHETAAPEGYELQDADIRLVIDPTLNQEAGIVTDWDASVSGGEGETETETDIVTHLVDAGDEAAMAQALEEGVISIQTSDDKQVIIPITGLDGTKTAIIVAGSVLVLSIAGLYINRRRTRQDDGQTE